MSYEDTVKALKIISTVTLGQFAGAAVYGAVAVQPALIEQDDILTSSMTMRSMLKRSVIMPLSQIISSVSALAVYFKTRGTPMHDSYWLASGGLMLAMIPYTIVFIGPINKQFRDDKENFDSNDSKWRELLSNWLTFHTPRSVIAFSLFSIGVYKLAYTK